MRKKIIALLSLGLLITVVWSFLGTCAETETPSLSVGDQWSYGWFNGEFTGEVGGHKMTVTVDRIEDFDGVQCYVYIDKDRDSDFINRTEITWMTSDWVILKTEEYEITPNFEQRITKIYNPGIKLYDFPLSVGKEWSGRSYIAHTVWANTTVMGEETGTGSEYKDWIRKVVSRETITVPAGTFDTYVIEEFRSGSGRRFWFSVDTKNHVKQEYLAEKLPEELEESLMELVGENVSLGGGEVLTSYKLAPQGNGSLNLPLIIALAAPIGVLGFTFIVYNRRRQGTRNA